MPRSILHEQERGSRMGEVRHLHVWIESTNGVVFSRLSEKSVAIWARYESTKRIIHCKDDGSEEVLDLEKIRMLPPPLPELPSMRSEPLPHVPNYLQQRF